MGRVSGIIHVGPKSRVYLQEAGRGRFDTTYTERGEGDVNVEQREGLRVAGLEDWSYVPRSKECQQPPEAGSGVEQILP